MSDIDKKEKRIRKVFPKGTRKILVEIKTLKIYKDFLQREIKFPAKVKPVGQFGWEEYYTSGFSEDKKEYEQLKKTRPTSHDIYSISKLDDFIDVDYGLFVRLTRLRDKKRFQMPLLDFEFVDKSLKGDILVNDYHHWFVNYK